MTQTVFFSWQSDVPAKYGKIFIEDALKKAIENIAGGADLEEAERPEIRIDKDTSGEGGNVSIIDTIHRKIEKCSVFIADITFVGRTDKNFIQDNLDRKISNPNVLIEYGYAVAKLGCERTILISNKAYLDAELIDLPFDIRHLRGPLYYDLGDHNNGESTPNRKENRKKQLDALAASLETSIKQILENYPISVTPPPPPEPFETDWVVDDATGELSGKGTSLGFANAHFGDDKEIFMQEGHSAWIYIRPEIKQSLTLKKNNRILMPIFGMRKGMRKLVSSYGQGFVEVESETSDKVIASSIVLLSDDGQLFSKDNYMIDTYETKEIRLGITNLKKNIIENVDILRNIGVEGPLNWTIYRSNVFGKRIPTYEHNHMLNWKKCDYENFLIKGITTFDGAGADIFKDFIMQLYKKMSATPDHRWFLDSYKS